MFVLSFMDEALRSALKAKFDNFEKRIKAGFALIREDVALSDEKVEKMRDYLRRWDKKSRKAEKVSLESSSVIQEQIDIFDQKINELKLVLSSMNSLKKEMVVVRDLSKIEERIKNSFRKDVDKYKDKVAVLELKIKSLQKMGVSALPGELEIDTPKENVKDKKKKSKQLDDLASKDDSSSRRKWSFFGDFDDEE
jgi:hypothetical protein